MSKGSKAKKKQARDERLKEKQKRATEMADPKGSSDYAKKTWNVDGTATSREKEGHTVEKW